MKERNRNEKKRTTLRLCKGISSALSAQIWVGFGWLRLSGTGGVAIRSLSRAEPRDLDSAIEERPKTTRR